MEGCFLVGPLIGVCSALAFADLVLVMWVLFAYSLAALVVGLALCRVHMFCSADEEDEKTREYFVNV